MLIDPSVWEESTGWRVDVDGEVGLGDSWTEKRRLRRRAWTVIAFDRRGLSLTVDDGAGLRVTYTAKKGGPGSCNVQMRIEGDDKAVAAFEKSDGDRLERLAAWLHD